MRERRYPRILTRERSPSSPLPALPDPLSATAAVPDGLADMADTEGKGEAADMEDTVAGKAAEDMAAGTDAGGTEEY